MYLQELACSVAACLCMLSNLIPPLSPSNNTAVTLAFSVPLIPELFPTSKPVNTIVPLPGTYFCSSFKRLAPSYSSRQGHVCFGSSLCIPRPIPGSPEALNKYRLNQCMNDCSSIGQGALWTWWILWTFCEILTNFPSAVGHWNHVTFPAAGPSHEVGGRAVISWAWSRSGHSLWHSWVTHRILTDIECLPYAFTDPSQCSVETRILFVNGRPPTLTRVPHCCSVGAIQFLPIDWFLRICQGWSWGEGGCWQDIPPYSQFICHCAFAKFCFPLHFIRSFLSLYP